MQEDDLLECPICFEKMTDIAFPFSASDDGACNHSFCMGCMQGIYDLSQNHGRFPQCPICRRTINSFVRNQLASSLVSCIDRLKVTMRETKESTQERDRKITTENESMAQRISELEGELVKSNSSSQGEAERSGHMRKMLHLLESEKDILSEHLRDMQKDLNIKVEVLDQTERRISELEQLVKHHQDTSTHAFEEAEQARAREDELLSENKSKEDQIQALRAEKKTTRGEVERGRGTY